MEITGKKAITAKQARLLKLALDMVMLVLLVLMYRKQVISLAFHEIGGLALIGLFIVHHLVNMRWIGAVTRRLFAKETPGLVRARYLVDVLLLVSFLAVGITGVLISKTLFSFHTAGNAKTLHYFASAVSIILMGIHLGLHADYIFGKVIQKGANRIAKVAIAVLLSCMVAFGGYSLFTTQFVSFLTAPIVTAQFEHGAFTPSGDAALDGAQGEQPSDIGELPEFAGDDAQLQQGDGAQPPQGDGSGSFGSGHGQGQGNGQGRGRGLGEGHGEGDSGNAALLIAQYVSIITLFGAVTVGVVKLTGKRKKRLTKETIVVAEIAE
jgi:uncharacterized membrane protein